MKMCGAFYFQRISSLEITADSFLSVLRRNKLNLLAHGLSGHI
jgi:hypothetical protein